MIQSAWEEYASIPILLTEDTLANPFAVQCAELLSLRTVSNEMQRKQIEAELVMLDKVIEDRDKQRGVVRFWAQQVRDALASKLPGEASVPAVVNELAFDLVDWEFSAFASGYDDYGQQFAYFTSVEAIKKRIRQSLKVRGIWCLY